MIPKQVFDKYTNLIDDLNLIIEKSLKLLVDKVSTKKIDHLYAISIYLNAIYGYKAIIQLLKNSEHYIIESNNILRSMLESLFVLKYLSKSPKNAIKRIDNNYSLYQNKRKLDVLKYDDLEKLRIYINEDEIEEIRKVAKCNKKRTGIKKWANQAGLSKFYHVIYDTLSVEAHTNFKSISNKLKIVDKNIIFNRPNEPQDYDTCLFTTFLIFLIVLETIQIIYKIDIEEDITNLDEKFSQTIKEKK
ncbi:MAG: DUF5677 domain-containing protein [Candidatus Neomarinimicrobiota bacterium]|jgi:hypothetical protein